MLISRILNSIEHINTAQMKHIFILIVLFISTTLSVVAQQRSEITDSTYVEEPEKYVEKNRKHLFTLAPLGLVQKVKVNYEYVLTSRTSIGINTAFYHTVMPGVQINPYFRLYFASKAPKGFYFQGQTGIYRHEIVRDYFYNLDSKESWNKPFGAVGLGAGVGHQWLTGRSKRFVITIMAGVKYYPMTFSSNNKVLYEDDAWYLIGPGSVFNGTLAIGFAK